MTKVSFYIISFYGRLKFMSKNKIVGLFIDDEEVLLELYAQAFDLNNIELITYASPSQALEELKAIGRTVDFVICDYDMPFINGLEFFAMMPEPYFADTVCILHSGALQRHKVPTKINHFHFVDKPVNLDELCVFIAVEVTKIRLTKAESSAGQGHEETEEE